MKKIRISESIRSSEWKSKLYSLKVLGELNEKLYPWKALLKMNEIIKKKAKALD